MNEDKRLFGRESLKNRVLPGATLVLIALLVVWLVLAPAESQLGNLVKLIYIHGALVWAGLLSFSVAGALGLAALVTRRAPLYDMTRAAAAAALVLWIIYALSSMAVTAMAWGQLIAWNEPRVRATALILIAAIVLRIVDRLVGHREFSAVVNLVMGILPWIVVRRAEAIRHPVDPIGGSGSAAIQSSYVLIVLTVVGLALTLIGWMWVWTTGREA